MTDLKVEGDDIVSIARADAIQAYANVETSLCMLLAHLLNAEPVIAGTIFYRIVNTRSRMAILSDLMRIKYADSYQKFWNSIVKFIRGQIDPRRNEIIHFHLGRAVYADSSGEHLFELQLIPPNYWGNRDDSITLNDMSEFTRKCGVVAGSLNIFTLILLNEPIRGSEGSRQTWLEIFQQPFVYPLPDTHPLSPNYEAPQSPPPPSRV